MNASWKTMIIKEMERRGESLADIEANTLSEEEMSSAFDAGFGGVEGKPFTIWTKDSIYFLVCYDGAEWVGSVSRNPDGKPTGHQGGC